MAGGGVWIGVGQVELRVRGVVLLLSRLIARELALYSAQRICAGAEQGELGLFKIVLVEFQLRLHEIQLLLDFLARGLSGAISFLLDAVDEFLIRLNLGFGVAHSSEEGLGLGCRGSLLERGLTHGFSKSEIDRMIGEPQRLLREALLVPGGGESGHAAGCLDGLLVYQRSPASCGRRRSGGIASQQERGDCGYDQAEESRDDNSLPGSDQQGHGAIRGKMLGAIIRAQSAIFAILVKHQGWLVTKVLAL